MPPITTTPPVASFGWLSLVTFAIFVGSTVYLWQFRATLGALALLLNQATKAVWIACSLLILATPSVSGKLFWNCFQHCCQILMIVTWFEFVLIICEQQNRFWNMVRYLVFVIAGGFLLFIALQEHLGIWYQYSFRISGADIVLRSGSLVQTIILFANLLYLVTLVLCLHWILRSRGLLRRQAMALSFPSLFSVAGIILGRVPAIQPYQPKIIGIALSGLLITWAFFRWRIYSILPLAHAILARSLNDALLVVDDQDYCVEMNDCARSLFGEQVGVGSKLSLLTAVWPTLSRFDAAGTPQRIEAEQNGPEGIRHFQVAMTPLVASNRHILGRIFTFRDITQQKQDQERLIAQQKAMAVLSERDRLARELHDTTGQFSSYVKTQAQAVKMLLARGNSHEAAILADQLIDSADIAFLDEREALTCLRHAPQNWNFFLRLDEWLTQFRTLSGLTVVYRGPAEPPSPWLQPEAEVHLLRVIQEILTNARKHAHAERVSIELYCASQDLRLILTDDGQGFYTETAQTTGHLGLEIIRERVAEMGGSCSIRSAPGQGTEVTITATLLPDHRKKEVCCHDYPAGG